MGNNIRSFYKGAAVTLWSVLSLGHASAQYNTPNSDSAFVFSPQDWDYCAGGALSEAEQAVNSQGYILTTERQISLPGNGLTSQLIIQDLDHAYGALAIVTHGIDGGLPGTEYFQSMSEAMNKVAFLVSNHYLRNSNEAIVSSAPTCNYSYAVWGVFLTD